MEFDGSLGEVTCVADASDVSTSDDARSFIRGGHSREVSSSSSWTSRTSERQCWADMADEEDSFETSVEQDSDAVSVGDMLSQGSSAHGTGQCKPCAFFHTKGCQSGAACLFCHACPPGEKQRRKQVHRRQCAPSGDDRRRVAKATRDISKDAAAGTSLPQPTNTASTLCLAQEPQSTAAVDERYFQTINETAVVNAHPTQNINSEFAECSTGTDGDVPGWGCQWVPAPGFCVERLETPFVHFTLRPQAGCASYLQV
uniref:C3H1-type domain-containing protein n=1 Tax=Noctiluca scintillans TaxID=2966 RepID=A0A7S1EYX0_NOCSC|mmetsp:Transcript_19571/g.52156  ORF Transcript_19571/g.52156 Transcript_19571/m.52156 type:complete len:257 (+) Transcript_19571:55-825(+)